MAKGKKKKKTEEAAVRVSNPLNEEDPASPTAEDAGGDGRHSPSSPSHHHFHRPHLANHELPLGLTTDEVAETLKHAEKVMEMATGAALHATADLGKDAAKGALKGMFAVTDALAGKELANVERTFKRIDVDESGFLDRDEIKLLMLELGKNDSEKAIDLIMEQLDPNGDGAVSLEEFKDWWVKAGHNHSVLGDSVGMMKDLTAAPILIFYHMFDENSEWFDTLGEPGIPLRYMSDVLTWSLNILQLVWSTAAILETLPRLSSDYDKNPDWEICGQVFWWINTICATLFMCEWLARIVGAILSKNFVPFLKDEMTWIDFVTNVSGWSIVFGYTPEFLGGGADGQPVDLRFFRIIRLSRVLKTLRNERINSLAPVVMEILQNSSIALSVPMFLLFIVVQCCASIFWMSEAQECGTHNNTLTKQSCTCTLGDGTVIENWDSSLEMNPGCIPTEDQCDSQGKCYGCRCAGELTHDVYDPGSGVIIQQSSATTTSIFDAWWWTLVTVTTVGYGDVSPNTLIGRLVGSTAGFLGLLIVAMPIAIVGGSFHYSFEHLEQRLKATRERKEERKRLKEKLRRQRHKMKMQSGDKDPKLMSVDEKLANLADKYAGDRLDVLTHLKLAREKAAKVEAVLSRGVEEGAERSDLGKILDTLAELEERLPQAWPDAPEPEPEPEVPEPEPEPEPEPQKVLDLE